MLCSAFLNRSLRFLANTITYCNHAENIDMVRLSQSERSDDRSKIITDKEIIVSIAWPQHIVVVLKLKMCGIHLE